MADNWSSVKAVASQILDNIDEFVDRVLTAVTEKIPGYTGLPVAELRPITEQNVVRMMTAVSERRGPNQQEISEAAAAAKVRASQYVAIEEILQGLQMLARELWLVFSEHAKSKGIEAALIMEVGEIFWRYTDAITLPMAQAHRSVELEIVRHDQAERQHFLNGVLFGTIGSTELGKKAAAYGLHPDHSYVSVRGRLFDADSAQELQRRMNSDDVVVLSGLVEGDFAGLALKRPTLRLRDGAIGVSPAASLRAMAPAFLLASQAFETALRFRQAGIFSIDDLPLQAGVLGEGHVGEVLWRRYVAPVGESDRKRRVLLGTVTAFLNNDRDLDRTASVLKVHPNTVRYRVSRFEKAVGVQFSITEDLVGVWWALQHDSIRTAESDEPSFEIQTSTREGLATIPDKEPRAKPRRRSKKRTDRTSKKD